MNKIISDRRLSYIKRVSEIYRQGLIAEDEAICLINEFHGEVVIC